MPKKKTRRRSGQNGRNCAPLTGGQTPPLAGVPTAPAAEPIMTNGPAAFVAALKTARERRGVTIDQIAHSTKVSASLLAALERGDLSRWPTGIFRRSFFRDYVAAIGLPPEPHMTQFVRFFQDEDEFARPVTRREQPHAGGGILDEAIGWLRRRLRAAHRVPVTSLSAGNS